MFVAHLHVVARLCIQQSIINRESKTTGNKHHEHIDILRSGVRTSDNGAESLPASTGSDAMWIRLAWVQCIFRRARILLWWSRWNWRHSSLYPTTILPTMAGRLLRKGSIRYCLNLLDCIFQALKLDSINSEYSTELTDHYKMFPDLAVWVLSLRLI